MQPVADVAHKTIEILSSVSREGWVTGYRFVPRAGQPMTYKQVPAGSRKLLRELHTAERIVV